MPFLINESEVFMKVDSGADVNVVSSNDWCNIWKSTGKSVPMTSSEQHQLLDYNGNAIETLGKFTAEIRCPKSVKSTTSEFFVAESRPQPVLSFATAQDLGILKISSSVHLIGEQKEFPCMPIAPIKLTIDANIQPKAYVYNNIPASLEKFVENHWDELESLGIIEAMKGPATWLSSVHVVPKKGNDHRIIIDMRNANKAIRREFYPMPNPERFLSQLGDAKIFTTLDLKSAYHHVLLDEASRYITAFMTKRGPRQFTRLPFGINCAPELFQKIMDDMLSGLEGVASYLDDILIYGGNVEELRQRTEAVMDRIRQNNLTLNNKKCSWEQQEVEFIGAMITSEGVRPADDKICAIKNFPRPETFRELRGFIGIVNYIGRHLPSISTVMEPMRQLLMGESTKLRGKAKLPGWTEEHEEAFKETKQVASNAILRGHYKLDQITAIMTDASPVGIAAMILQRENKNTEVRVIACASRSLTDTERRYPQTQREALAIVWGVEKFFYYLAGREFTIITDHKPMEFIFGNASPKTNKRALTRAEAWSARLGQYRFLVKVIPSKANEADILSRMPVPTMQPTHVEKRLQAGDEFKSIDTITVAPHQLVAENLPLSYETLREETEKDLELQAVIRSINGEQDWNDEAKSFARLRDELSLTDGLILRGTRIVIPKSLQRSTIAVAHRAHPGMSITKNQLRRSVWWPAMDRSVEHFVKTCVVCLQLSKSDAPEPLVMSEFPERPWENIAIDYWSTGAMNEYILVAKDYYSKAIQATALNESTTQATIQALEKFFRKLGWVASIKHDNGPQFASAEFQTWLENNRIKSYPTTPRNAQENGLVERHMASIGRAMKIAKLERRNIRDALEEHVDAYNSWPHCVTGIPPRDLLYGRVTRNEIPATKELFEKYPLMDDIARMRNKEFQIRKKEETDLKRRAKDSGIKAGDWVHLKNDSRPNKLAPNFSEQSYMVVRRNGGRLTLSVDGKERIRKTTDVKLKRDDEHLGTGIPIAEKNLESGRPINIALRRSTRERRTPRQFTLSTIQRTNTESKGIRGQRTKEKNKGSHCRSCGESNDSHGMCNNLSSCNAPTAVKRCFDCNQTGHFAYRCVSNSG